MRWPYWADECCGFEVIAIESGEGHTFELFGSIDQVSGISDDAIQIFMTDDEGERSATIDLAEFVTFKADPFR